MSDAEGWEARMAARAAARHAAAVHVEAPGPHAGHTQHMCMNVLKCSCGQTLGVTCLAIEDPDALVEVPCPVCGDMILTTEGITP